MNRHVKNIGIVGSYAWLLIAYYFFEWNAGIIMFSYLIEIAVLAIIYEILEITDIIKHREKNKRKYNSGSVIAGTAGFLFIQGAIIYLTMLKLDPYFKEKVNTYIHSYEIYFAIAGIMIFYIIDAFRIKNSHKRIMNFQSTFVINVLLLFAGNLFVFILVHVLDVESSLIIMIILVLIRILIELVLVRKTEVT